MGKKVLLSYSGGAGAYPALFAKGYVIHAKLRRRYRESQITYAGVSVGTVPAIVMALGICEADLNDLHDEFLTLFDAWYKRNILYFVNAGGILIDKLLERHDWRRLNGKLHIGITKLTRAGMKQMVVSRFTSAEDVKLAAKASGHLFLINTFPVTVYRGEVCIDGGFVKNHVELETVRNVVINTWKLTLKDKVPDVSHDKWMDLYSRGRRTAKRHYADILAGKNNG